MLWPITLAVSLLFVFIFALGKQQIITRLGGDRFTRSRRFRRLGLSLCAVTCALMVGTLICPNDIGFQAAKETGRFYCQATETTTDTPAAAPTAPAEPAATDAPAAPAEPIAAATDAPVEPIEGVQVPDETIGAVPTDGTKKAPVQGTVTKKAEEEKPSWTWKGLLEGLLNVVIALGLCIVVPFWIGSVLANQFKMPNYSLKIGFILFTLISALVINITGWPPERGIDLRGGSILLYRIGEDADRAAVQALSPAIAKRINPGGEKQVEVSLAGEHLLQITVPHMQGEDEQTRIAALEQLKLKISQTGMLEFRCLANPRYNQEGDMQTITKALATESRNVTEKGEVIARWVPLSEKMDPKDRARMLADKDLIQQTKVRRGKEVTEILVLEDQFQVNGDYLRNTSVGMGTRGVDVEFEFNQAGAYRFQGLTSTNLPESDDLVRRLGIILDGYLQSAPTIQSTITTRGQITGNFTRKEAQDLVDILNAGSLPAEISKYPISENTIGPTLGADMIRKGSWAIGISLIAVLVFMAFYYRFSGFVACFALIANLVLIMGIVITFNITLTLSGLAGLVLTVGMAVDANVLIFERIREELNRGSQIQMAVITGFQKATTTIVDANLTTLITAIVLYSIGTDRVKGFAVMLILGILLSMYTAIFVSRVIYDVGLKRKWITKLNMRRILVDRNFDFLGKRRIAIACSIILICVGMFCVYSRGKGLFNRDFTGGTAVQVQFETPKKIADIRKTLSPILPDLSVSDADVEGQEKGTSYVINTSLSDDKPEVAVEKIKTDVRDRLSKVFSAEEVSADYESQINRLGLQVRAALNADPESKSQEGLVELITKSVNSLFAKVPDAETKKADIDAIMTHITRELKTSTQEIEAILVKNFSDLDTNGITESSYKTITTEMLKGDATSGDTTPAPAESPAPTDQSRTKSIDSSVFGNADMVARMILSQTEEPAPAEPATTEPATETAPAEPTTTEPATETAPAEPATTEPATETAPAEPVTTEPATEPAPAEPVTTEPATEPAPAEPVTTEPATEPAPAEPATTEPATEPAPAEPAMPMSLTPGTPTVPATPATPTIPATSPYALPGVQPPMAQPPMTLPTTGSTTTEEAEEEEEPEVSSLLGGTQIKLKFRYPINQDAVDRLVERALGSQVGVYYKIENADIVDPSEAVSEWTVDIALPESEIPALITAVDEQLKQHPYFPFSNAIRNDLAWETSEQAIVAILVSLLFIIAYIWIRFQRVTYGLAACAALIHDVLFTLGVIAGSAYVAGALGFLGINEFKIGLDELAAFLTIIGYSLNDTIVVFDRIREVRKKQLLSEKIINESINQTLSRTLLTSITTLLVVLILYTIGGQAIHSFAFALVVGVLVGTYSSIFIASPVLLWLTEKMEKHED